MTHIPPIESTDLYHATEPARGDPVSGPPVARSAGVLAAAAERILAAHSPARIHAALIWSARRLPLGGQCAVLEEFPGDALVPVLSHGLTPEAERVLASSCNEPDAREALRAGRTVLTPLMESPTMERSTLVAVPLMGTRPAAFLVVLVPETFEFGAEEQDSLRVLTDLATSALQMAVARFESARRANRLRALHEIGVAVSRELDLSSLYEVVHRETGRVLKVDAFYIALWDAERQTIHFPYSWDRGRCDIPEDTGLTGGPCGWVIRHRQPFVATDENRGIRESGDRFGTGEASRSALHVPMLLGDRVVGVMSTQSYDADAYGEEDLHLFQMVAGQTAVAVENARLYQAVQDLSVTDDLTGLPNRRAGMRRLEEELARAMTPDDELGILMLDLDHFKRVNDTYGHTTGDDLLREVADLLRVAVRQSDTVARWGGEEFLIVLPRTSREGVASVAEHLRSTVAAHSFLAGGMPLPQTITIGGLCLTGCYNAPAQHLLDAVDASLYRAKEAGRNRAIVEDSDR